MPRRPPLECRYRFLPAKRPLAGRLFGLFYRGDAIAATTPLAQWHFYIYIAVLGMIFFIPGIYGANVGNATLTAFTIPGALLTLASMLIFAWTVWQAAQHKG